MSLAPATRLRGTGQELSVSGRQARARLGGLATLCFPHCSSVGKLGLREKGRWLRMRKGAALMNVLGHRGFLQRKLVSLQGSYSREVCLHPSCLRA